MAIECENLVIEKARKFGAAETSVDFQQKAVDSFNYCLDDIESECGQATTRIELPTDSVDLDDQPWHGIISLGMDYYLCLFHEYKTMSIQELRDIYERKLKGAGRRGYLSEQSMYGPRGDMSDDD